MAIRWLMQTAIITLAVGGTCQAVDAVKTTKTTIPGHITGISATAITLEQGQAGSVSKSVPVNEIQTVFFDSEPAELRMAKNHVLAGRYVDALTALERIRQPNSRAEIQQDIEFYKALCAAKLALAGNGKIADAGRLMKAFADANDSSYHYFEAAEIVGDMLVAIGQYAPAAQYYARLEKAPWPDYQMRAGVATGRALLAQGNVIAAEAAFDRILAMEAKDSLTKAQQTLAKLGKAAALVAAKKPDDAIKIVDDVLQTADPEDAAVLARAYNVLGTAHRQAGRTKDALFAFLHVDLLYPTVPDAHAEALANLAALWEQLHKVERANQARKTLEDQYKDSPWAKEARREN